MYVKEPANLSSCLPPEYVCALLCAVCELVNILLFLLSFQHYFSSSCEVESDTKETHKVSLSPHNSTSPKGLLFLKAFLFFQFVARRGEK